MSEKESKRKTYECTECNFVTIYANSYKRHVMSGKHNTTYTGIIVKKKKEKVTQIYKCEKCDYTDTHKYNRDNHYLKNHASEEERKNKFTYYCEACCFGTMSNKDNASHTKTTQHIRLMKIFQETQKKLQNMKNT